MRFDTRDVRVACMLMNAVSRGCLMTSLPTTFMPALIALADVERLRILVAITDSALTVLEIAERCTMVPDAIGKHLQVLGAAGLLATDRSQNARRYRLQISRLTEIQLAINNLAGEHPSDPYRIHPSPVAQRFFDGERLATFPSKRASQIEVLMFIVSDFETGRDYPEAEVNAILARRNPDFATLRRALIDEGLMSRVSGIYRRI